MDVRIRLLGRFELTCGGVVAIDAAWKPAKAAAIIKMLALRPGRSMHRDQLIAALWPDADTDAGANSLYKNLHQLRRTVRRAGGPRDVVHLDHPAIALAPYIEVDIDEFRRRARDIRQSSSARELQGLLALSGGTLLPDDLYEPWTEPHRGEIQLQTTRLRLQLAAAQLMTGAFDDAIEQYNAVLTADDLSEDAHRGLMRAYATSGQRALALRQYERCRDRLAAELDTAPSADTEALLEEIRAGRLQIAVAETISEPGREGDDAMRRHDYPDAILRYREAIARLQAAGLDCEREATVWLKLARATNAAGAFREVAECCWRAADLAARAGASELQARALVQFQSATDATPDNHAGHREAAELIQAALDALPPGPSAARAMLLAASARPLAASARPDNERHVTGRQSVAGHRDPEIERRLRDALAIARAVGRPDVLTITLLRLRTYITSPDTLEERLELTRELLGLATASRHAVSEYEARLFRHEDLLESGDVDGARIEARAMRRVGESAQSSGILAVAFSLQGTHDTADGKLADAALALRQSIEQDAKHGETSNSRFRLGSQLLALRWHQGRIAELEPGFRRTVDTFPRMMSARAALALIYAETGKFDNARAELETLTEQPVESIPKDFNWWLVVVFMSYAAVAVGAASVAQSLYSLILPYAGRNANSAGAISFGSAELALGMLGGSLGQYDAAVQHFERAVTFNVRTRQRTWAARARFQYATVLRARGAAADLERAAELSRVALADAREIGMPRLAAPHSS